MKYGRTNKRLIGNDMSKIHFESNSQHAIRSLLCRCHWKRYVKDTFWKQFTTALMHRLWRCNWKRYVKDTFWKQFTTTKRDINKIKSLETICQRYILKAIHNPFFVWKKTFHIGNDMSKIHFESNSQSNYFFDCLLSRVKSNDLSRNSKLFLALYILVVEIRWLKPKQALLFSHKILRGPIFFVGIS